MLRGLEARGLIGRAVSGKDGRRRSIAPTREGEDVLREAGPSLERAQQDLLAPLSSPERKQLATLLARLCNAFNETSRAPVVRPALPAKKVD